MLAENKTDTDALRSELKCEKNKVQNLLSQLRSLEAQRSDDVQVQHKLRNENAKKITRLEKSLQRFSALEGQLVDLCLEVRDRSMEDPRLKVKHAQRRKDFVSEEKCCRRCKSLSLRKLTTFCTTTLVHVYSY